MATADRIAIVGAGLMGHGIAQVFAVAGHEVFVHDPIPASLETLHERIERNLADLDQDRSAVKRVHACPDLGEALADADIVFEAAPEKLPLKQELFVAIDGMARPDALIASNTSVIPIGRIAERVPRKDRILGTHWWNPPYLVPLVEVVETEGTAPDAISHMIALLRAVGKTPVHVKKDVPGFVGNRL
jgi:3-hydroxybutyryl-CoA dehydrogenase